MATLDAKMRSLGKNVTMTVTICLTRELRFRIWVATRLFRLAGWVLNCNILVEQCERPGGE